MGPPGRGRRSISVSRGQRVRLRVGSSLTAGLVRRTPGLLAGFPRGSKMTGIEIGQEVKMNQLIVVAFDHLEDARKAMKRLRDIESEGRISFEDTAIVERMPDGTAKVRNELSGTTETGAVVGALVGGFVMLAFPLLGAALGAVAGAAVGAALDKGVSAKVHRGRQEHPHPRTIGPVPRRQGGGRRRDEGGTQGTLGRHHPDDPRQRGRRGAPPSARIELAASIAWSRADHDNLGVTTAPDRDTRHRSVSILRDPAFGRLWFVQASTQVGGNMALYALTVLVFATTRSNAAVSALVMSFLLPTIALSAVAGVVVDRLEPSLGPRRTEHRPGRPDPRARARRGERAGPPAPQPRDQSYDGHAHAGGGRDDPADRRPSPARDRDGRVQPDAPGVVRRRVRVPRPAPRHARGAVVRAWRRRRSCTWPRRSPVSLLPSAPPAAVEPGIGEPRAA